MRTTTGFGAATLRAIEDLTPSIRAFDIEPAQGAPAFAPGSHVDLLVQVDGRPQVRSYSLVDRREDCWRIAVRRADTGRGGSAWLWSLAPGARLNVSAPRNHFELRLGRPHYLLVAAGIGVTPLLPMVRVLVAAGASVSMVYTVRSRADAALLAPLAGLLGDRLVLHVSGEGGRLPMADLLDGLPAGTECYACGPMPLLDDLRRAWRSAGRAAAALRFETFGNSGHHAPEPFTVEVPRHGLSLTVPADASLLDVLEAAGVEVLADCRRGECGLCVVDVHAVRGTLDHRDVFLGDADRAAGRRLCACVSRVVGGGVTIDSSFREDALCLAARPDAQ